VTVVTAAEVTAAEVTAAMVEAAVVEAAVMAAAMVEPAMVTSASPMMTTGERGAGKGQGGPNATTIDNFLSIFIPPSVGLARLQTRLCERVQTSECFASLPPRKLKYPARAASAVAGPSVTRRLFDVRPEGTSSRRARDLSLRAGGHGDRSQHEQRRR